jgi:hypothetical protein
MLGNKYILKIPKQSYFITKKGDYKLLDTMKKNDSNFTLFNDQISIDYILIDDLDKPEIIEYDYNIKEFYKYKMKEVEPMG